MVIDVLAKDLDNVNALNSATVVRMNKLPSGYTALGALGPSLLAFQVPELDQKTSNLLECLNLCMALYIVLPSMAQPSPDMILA